MHVVPFTVAAAAAASEVETAADRRAAELAAVCQQSVGHRGSRSDGDVARSRQDVDIEVLTPASVHAR